MEVNRKPNRKPQFKKPLPIEKSANTITEAEMLNRIQNFKEELNKMNSVGIDKTILSNIIIESIDLNKLMAQPSNKRSVQLSNTTTGYPVINTVSQETILLDTLTIKDNGLFNSFKLNYKLNRGHKTYYTILDLTVSNNEGHNLKPYTYTEYLEHLGRIRLYLIENYGITINVSEAKFKSIEINNTQQMAQPFQEYLPILEAIEPFISKKRFTHRLEVRRVNQQPNTVYFRNNQMTLKFYNKSNQLQELSFTCEDNLLRIEYTLTNKGVSRQLKSNKIADINQNTIVTFFNESLFTDLVEPFNKAINSSNTKVIKLYHTVKKQKQRGAFREFIHRLNASDILIDSQQLYDIATYELKHDTHKSRHKKIMEDLLNPKYQNVLNKFHELIDKFL